MRHWSLGPAWRHVVRTRWSMTAGDYFLSFAYGWNRRWALGGGYIHSSSHFDIWLHIGPLAICTGSVCNRGILSFRQREDLAG